MVTIKAQTDKPCFICGSKESMEVKFDDKSFTGSLCATHVYEKVRKEVPNSQGKGTGRTD